MSIRVLAPAAGGKAYCYHVSPSLGEHFFVASVRRDSRATYLICALDDAVTSIPRTASNADHREVQTLIDAGGVAPLIHPDDTPLDPLQASKDDGDIGTLVVIPKDTAGRKALCEELRAKHVDRRPARW